MGLTNLQTEDFKLHSVCEKWRFKTGPVRSAKVGKYL